MGVCLSCCGGNTEEETNLTVSPEERRNRALEAAEKRKIENESRGIKDLDKVRRQQARAEEMERRELELAKSGGGAPNLRWTQD